MNKEKQWTWWKTSLWIYSIIYILLVYIGSLGFLFNPIPLTAQEVVADQASGANRTAIIVTLILFLPVVIFLITVGIDNFRLENSHGNKVK